MLHKFDSQAKPIKSDGLSEPATLPINMDPKEPLAQTCNEASHVLIVERVKIKVPRSMVEKAVRITATLLGVLSAMLCILIMALCVKNVFQTDSIDMMDAEAFLNRVYLSILLLLALFFFVHYIFSITLLNGLDTSRSKFVLVYFVFGVLVATFGSALLSAANVWENVPVRLNVFFIFTFVIYSVFLGFVWNTFQKYEQREAMQASTKCNPTTSF